MHLVFSANPNRHDTVAAARRMMAQAQQQGFDGTLMMGADDAFPKDAEAIVAVGGDVNFIRTAHLACAHGVPLFGVNCGRVGFLTEQTEATFSDALHSLKTGAYTIVRHTLLACRINDGAPSLCLNDLLIYKHSFSGVVRIDFSVDEHAVGELYGDGLIVATPLGATGYSLSAGGPIVADGLACMTITPICPHTLHIRPIVASMDSTVVLSVSDRGFVAADGDRIAEVGAGDRITITRADAAVSVLTFGKRNVFRLISEKLS